MESLLSQSNLQISDAQDVWVSICVGDYKTKRVAFKKEARFNSEMGIAKDREVPVAMQQMLDKCLTELAREIQAEVLRASHALRPSPKTEPSSD